MNAAPLAPNRHQAGSLRPAQTWRSVFRTKGQHLLVRAGVGVLLSSVYARENFGSGGEILISSPVGTYSAEATPNTEHRTPNIEHRTSNIERRTGSCANSAFDVGRSMFDVCSRSADAQARQTDTGLAVCVRLSTPAAAARSRAWSRFGAFTHGNGCFAGGGFW
jgi:hypothetical protein